VQQVTSDQRVFRDLQASLDAYQSKQLEFDELRTKWIIALSDNPAMCKRAVRMIYQQPKNDQLSEGHALSLKRVVESAFQDGPEDSTIVFDDDDDQTSVVIDTGDDTYSLQNEPVSKAAGPGSVLGERFVLEQLIGRGGIGDVYRAHDRFRQDANAGSAKIALKILRQEFRGNQELVRALRREALQAQSLSHPNVIRIHDFHQDGDTYFLTMELLVGKPLRAVLSQPRSRPMSRDRAMHIIVGLCRGLAHAHARRVVHADFKPGNVILTAGDEPRILDFGLAQAAVPSQGSVNGSSRPPGKSLRAITPAYASCNRLEGGTPSFSDDVYSLSCVIYELLTGQHPFGRKSALVARELGLQPKRISGLTDLQWRCLSAGLSPWRQDFVPQVYDLQEAFAARPALPVQRPVTRTKSNPPRQPVRHKSGRSGVTGALIFGALLGASLVTVTTLLDVEVIPTKYVDIVSNSTVVKNLRARIDDRETVAAAANNPPAQKVTAPVSAMSDSKPEMPVVGVAEGLSETRDTPAGGASASEVDASLSILPDQAAVAFNRTGTPGFRLAASEYLITEGSAALAVEIRRYGDFSAPATVEWMTIANSAKPQFDYVGFDRSRVRFEAGEEIKTVFIPIVADTAAEGEEDFRVALSRPGDNMVLSEPFTASVTIIDDDT
jgi:serine/threonine protein kinase